MNAAGMSAPNQHRTVAKSSRRSRPTYSCSSCHKRKVKCDRVKPCGACCLRGNPSGCEYSSNGRDRHYIEQDDLIYRLWQSCESLQHQLDEARGKTTPADNGRYLRSLSPETKELLRVKEQDADSSDGLGEVVPYRSFGGHIPDFASLPARLAPLATNHAFITEASANQVTDVCIERFLNDFSPASAAVSGSVVEWRTAAALKDSSLLLNRAFTAAALTLGGFREGDQSLRMAGQVRYIGVLRLLQSTLNHPTESLSTGALIVVVLFTIIEAFKQSSPASIHKHQLGGLQILQLRTPHRHCYGVERSLFVDLRMYWITAALVHRKPTFLASEEWRTVPWHGDASPKDILHQLLDIAADIPEYLSRVDEFSARLDEGSIQPTGLQSSQSSILDSAMQLDSRLQQWKFACVDRFPAGKPWEEPQASAADEFPVFRCRDPRTLAAFTPTWIVYPDLLLAMSMCFWWATRLILSADPSIPGVISPEERYQLACNICRSVRYYILGIPGCLVSRLMFVLRVAFDTFADGMIEKEYVTHLFGYVGEKFRFPVFSNKCTSFELRKTVDTGWREDSRRRKSE